MKHTLLLALCALSLIACHKAPQYSWEQDLQHRLAYDFSWTKADVKEAIAKIIPEVTDEQIDRWTEQELLETMVIDGELRYFRRSVNNLFRLDSACHARKVAQQIQLNESAHGTSLETDDDLEAKHLRQVSVEGNPLAAPRRLRVTCSITVKPDAVPAGEVIRCWLPYPRTDVPRQTDVVFLGANHPVIMPDPECEHSTTYQECKACAGEPTVFETQFEYTVYGEYWSLDDLRERILPYDTSSELYQYYTAEREKHVIFTDQMRHLSDSLTAGLTHPLDKVEAIFRYLDTNFPWGGAREYSTIPNIPEYVLHIGHGDCGQQTLLFITLARVAGIPCRFQSGLTTDPSGWNMHDWSETWFEGVGWVPLDASRGLCDFDNVPELFYMTGFEHHRMIVNNDFGMPLSPTKTFPRSDDVDFQHGEVEWRGGNIYMDQFSFDMEYEDIPLTEEE